MKILVTGGSGKAGAFVVSELAAAGQGDVEGRALAAYVRTLFGANEFLHLD